MKFFSAVIFVFGLLGSVLLGFAFPLVNETARTVEHHFNYIVAISGAVSVSLLFYFMYALALIIDYLKEMGYGQNREYFNSAYNDIKEDISSQLRDADLKVETKEKGDSKKITIFPIAITNHTTQTIREFALKISFLDENGEVIESRYIFVEKSKILPEQTIKTRKERIFKSFSSVSYSYEFAIENVFGGKVFSVSDAAEKKIIL